MNCKKGDLAIIVNDDCPENIGKLVEVIGYGGDYVRDGFHWRCRPLGGPLHYFKTIDGADIGKAPAPADDWADVPDRNLRPIRPGDLTETTEREVALAR